MNVWKLDIQLPVQSVPISTKVVSLNPAHDEVYSIRALWFPRPIQLTAMI